MLASSISILSAIVRRIGMVAAIALSRFSFLPHVAAIQRMQTPCQDGAPSKNQGIQRIPFCVWSVTHHVAAQFLRNLTFYKM